MKSPEDRDEIKDELKTPQESSEKKLRLVLSREAQLSFIRCGKVRIDCVSGQLVDWYWQ